MQTISKPTRRPGRAIADATFDNRFDREFQHPTIGGLDALQHASEAKIPVLLYHGDRDQTVAVEQSEAFAAKLRGANKPYKLVIIKDMGHQYVFADPGHDGRATEHHRRFSEDGCKAAGFEAFSAPCEPGAEQLAEGSFVALRARQAIDGEVSILG